MRAIHICAWLWACLVASTAMLGCASADDKGQQIPSVGKRQLSADEASEQLKQVAIALDAYRKDVDSYPTQQQGLEPLSSKPSDETVAARWKGPYLKASLTATSHLYVGREFVLMTQVDPRLSGWKEFSSFGTKGWERRASGFVLQAECADGRVMNLVPLNQFGPMPKGGYWVGPVAGSSGIPKGQTIGNMPTSSGAVIMLLAQPEATSCLEWVEPGK